MPAISKYRDAEIEELCSDKKSIEQFKILLTPRQYQVLIMREGHYNNKKWSYSKIGLNLNKILSHGTYDRPYTGSTIAKIYYESLKIIRIYLNK